MMAEDEDEFDIYADLPNFDLEGTIQKLESEKKSLASQVKQLTETVDKLQLSNNELSRVAKNLKANISSLVKTSRDEINRKDKYIAELREQLDNICFRRSNHHVQPSQRQPAATVSERSEENGKLGSSASDNVESAHPNLNAVNGIRHASSLKDRREGERRGTGQLRSGSAVSDRRHLSSTDEDAEDFVKRGNKCSETNTRREDALDKLKREGRSSRSCSSDTKKENSRGGRAISAESGKRKSESRLKTKRRSKSSEPDRPQDSRSRKKTEDSNSAKNISREDSKCKVNSKETDRRVDKSSVPDRTQDRNSREKTVNTGRSSNVSDENICRVEEPTKNGGRKDEIVAPSRSQDWNSSKKTESTCTNKTAFVENNNLQDEPRDCDLRGGEALFPNRFPDQDRSNKTEDYDKIRNIPNKSDTSEKEPREKVQSEDEVSGLDCRRDRNTSKETENSDKSGDDSRKNNELKKELRREDFSGGFKKAIDTGRIEATQIKTDGSRKKPNDEVQRVEMPCEINHSQQGNKTSNDSTETSQLQDKLLKSPKKIVSSTGDAVSNKEAEIKSLCNKSPAKKVPTEITKKKSGLTCASLIEILVRNPESRSVPYENPRMNDPFKLSRVLPQNAAPKTSRLRLTRKASHEKEVVLARDELRRKEEEVKTNDFSLRNNQRKEEAKNRPNIEVQPEHCLRDNNEEVVTEPQVKAQLVEAEVESTVSAVEDKNQNTEKTKTPMPRGKRRKEPCVPVRHSLRLSEKQANIEKANKHSEGEVSPDVSLFQVLQLEEKRKKTTSPKPTENSLPPTQAEENLLLPLPDSTASHAIEESLPLPQSSSSALDNSSTKSDLNLSTRSLPEASFIAALQPVSLPANPSAQQKIESNKISAPSHSLSEPGEVISTPGEGLDRPSLVTNQPEFKSSILPNNSQNKDNLNDDYNPNLQCDFRVRRRTRIEVKMVMKAPPSTLALNAVREECTPTSSEKTASNRVEDSAKDDHSSIPPQISEKEVPRCQVSGSRPRGSSRENLPLERADPLDRHERPRERRSPPQHKFLRRDERRPPRGFNFSRRSRSLSPCFRPNNRENTKRTDRSGIPAPPKGRDREALQLGCPPPREHNSHSKHSRGERYREERSRGERSHAREGRLRNGRFQEERAREDRLREERSREQRFREDRLREERAREERSREDRLREERAREERSREDRLREERAREERSRENRVREERAREDRLREERTREHRVREERPREERPREERSREERAREDLLHKGHFRAKNSSEDGSCRERCSGDRSRSRGERSRSRDDSSREKRYCQERSHGDRDERHPGQDSLSKGLIAEKTQPIVMTVIRRRAKTASLQDSLEEKSSTPSQPSPTNPTTLSSTSRLVQTPLDFRERYAEVFSNTRESIESGSEGVFSESESAASNDSDVSYRPKTKRKRAPTDQSKTVAKRQKV